LLAGTTGEREAASGVVEAGRALGRASDDRDWSEVVASELGHAYGRRGRLVEGLVLLEETFEAALQRRAHSSASFRAVILSTVYLLAGRLDEARQTVHQGGNLARQPKRRRADARA